MSAMMVGTLNLVPGLSITPPADAFVIDLRHSAATGEEMRVSGFASVTPPDGNDDEDASVRAYVSHLWTEDWDCAEDSVYDKW